MVVAVVNPSENLTSKSGHGHGCCYALAEIDVLLSVQVKGTDALLSGVQVKETDVLLSDPVIYGCEILTGCVGFENDPWNDYDLLICGLSMRVVAREIWSAFYLLTMSVVDPCPCSYLLTSTFYPCCPFCHVHSIPAPLIDLSAAKIPVYHLFQLHLTCYQAFSALDYDGCTLLPDPAIRIYLCAGCVTCPRVSISHPSFD